MEKCPLYIGHLKKIAIIKIFQNLSDTIKNADLSEQAVKSIQEGRRRIRRLRF